MQPVRSLIARRGLACTTSILTRILRPADAWQVLEGHVGHDQALQERVGLHRLDSHVPGVGRSLAHRRRQGGMPLTPARATSSVLHLLQCT